MPRIRTLRPEHRSHRKVGPLSDFVYRLWVSMILEADDDGRLTCDAGQLRLLTWGYHPAVTVAAVEAAIRTLAKVRLIGLYVVRGVRYAAFPSWRDHQKMKYYTPSRLPGARPGPRARLSVGDALPQSRDSAGEVEGECRVQSRDVLSRDVSSREVLSRSLGSATGRTTDDPAGRTTASAEAMSVLEHLSPAGRERVRESLARRGQKIARPAPARKGGTP